MHFLTLSRCEHVIVIDSRINLKINEKNISRLNQFLPHYAIALFWFDVHFLLAFE